MCSVGDENQSETKYRLEIELPGIPKTINALGSSKHWRVVQQHNLKWKRDVMLACRQKEPKAPLKKCTITYTRFSSRYPDFDNLVNSFKVVQDGLVLAKIIENDSMAVIHDPKYCFEKCKQKEARITIIVEAL